MNEEKERRLLLKLPKTAIIMLYQNERNCFNQLVSVVELFNKTGDEK